MTRTTSSIKPMHDVAIAVGDALLVVDVQNDFLPGGRLAVPQGDAVVPRLNRHIDAFVARALPVFASRDWHPLDHCSFAAQGGPWPVHCVAESSGAAFAQALRLPPGTRVISKATARDRDAYSAFEGTNLDACLRAGGIERLFVGGLATDYCVHATVRDARRLDYAVVLLMDAIRAVEVTPGDGQRAVDDMLRLGATLLMLDRLIA